MEDLKNTLLQLLGEYNSLGMKGRSMVEQLMNLDLKSAYEASMKLAKGHTPFSVDMLKDLSALVMKNTGSVLWNFADR